MFYIIDFSFLCGCFCIVDIKKCSKSYDDFIGVKLIILLFNFLIESKVDEDIVFIECDFLILINLDNESKFLCGFFFFMIKMSFNIVLIRNYLFLIGLYFLVGDCNEYFIIEIKF